MCFVVIHFTYLISESLAISKKNSLISGKFIIVPKISCHIIIFYIILSNSDFLFRIISRGSLYRLSKKKLPILYSYYTIGNYFFDIQYPPTPQNFKHTPQMYCKSTKKSKFTEKILNCAKRYYRTE